MVMLLYLITMISYEMLCRKWWNKTVQSYNFVVPFASAHHTMSPTVHCVITGRIPLYTST